MSSAAIRAALFDLDGTLVDSLPTIADAMVAALALHGYSFTAAEIIPQIGPPMNELAQELTGVSDAEAERMNEDYLRIYHDDYIHHTPEHAGAGALLERLASTGLRMAVVTNKVEFGGREMVRIQGWERYFGAVVGRETAGASKPSAAPARYALEVLDVPPEQAAIVGDTEFDMQCGQNAGLALVIGVIGERSEAHLREHGATHVVRSLDEVAPIILGAGVPS